MKHPSGNPHHDRLDLKMSSLTYSNKPCGSINLQTHKPEFCDFDCPTLHGTQKMPEPHWIADPEKVMARQRELLEANVQASTKELGAPVSGVPSDLLE